MMSFNSKTIGHHRADVKTIASLLIGRNTVILMYAINRTYKRAFPAQSGGYGYSDIHHVLGPMEAFRLVIVRAL